jgi:tight adherence protein B
VTGQWPDMDSNVILGIAFATLSAVGFIHSLLYPLLSGQARAGKRQKQFTSPLTTRMFDSDFQTRQKRGQIAQSLKQLESRENAHHKLSLEARIAQAGFDWDRRKFYTVSAISATILACLFLYATNNLILFFAGLFVGGVGFPRWFLTYTKRKRILRFTRELPNALDVIVRGIKSGLPLADCLRIIATEAVEPVRTEFRLIIESQILGLTLPEAAAKLYQRMPSTEANFFGIVLAIQQQSGGNLGEILGNLSKVIRERRKMRDRIQAASMEAKTSAAIIGSLPLFVAVLVYLTTPRYIEPLWLTQFGRIALAASALWMAVGIVIMRQLINFRI